MTTKIRVREQHSSEVWKWCSENLKIGTWRTWIGFVSTSYNTFEFDDDYAVTLVKLLYSDYIE